MLTLDVYSFVFICKIVNNLLNYSNLDKLIDISITTYLDKFRSKKKKTDEFNFHFYSILFSFFFTYMLFYLIVILFALKNN